MGYEALLFCPDEKTARTVTQVLSELEFNVEACLEPFAAVKKLMGQHFDAVVVDCDNEQNATLLFKSARNSTSNQASLAVAVVEGQAGVAKAFRIGANLVLTKPINIEQSKGTLRVARGLLRKGEAPKPAAAAPVSSAGVGVASTPAAAAAKPVAAKPVAPARPTGPAKPPAVGAPRPAVSAAPKPAAKPPLRPAAAATTTSIPVAQVPAAHNPVPSAVPATGHSAVPDDDVLEISAENSTAAPAPAALTPSARIAALPPRAMRLPPPAVPAAQAAVKPASSSNIPASSGAASAPAPAREAEQAHVEPSQVAEISLENAATATADKPAETSASDSGYAGAAPAFTFGGANVPEEKTGKSKKTFLGIAAVVLVGGALYYGWTQYKSTASQPVVPVATKPAPVAAKPASASSIPATTTAPATAPTDSASSSLPGSQPAAGPATNPDDDDSADSAVPASTKPSGSAPSAAGKTAAPDKTGSDRTDSNKAGSDKTGSDKTAPSKTGSAKPAPLVVKGGTAPTLQAAPTAPDAPAPSMTGIAVAGSSAPPPNLGSTGSVPKPVLQTVSISQGVSRGLLIHQVSPVYPKTALAMRIEGTVELTTTIAKTGDITHVKIVSGDPQLAKAAADAVKQWKYKPYLLNGEPVDIQTAVTVNFKLPN